MITEDPFPLSKLERALLSIATAPTASEALERLLEGAHLLAPRVALLLVRHGRIRGWRALGHDPEATRRLQRTDLPLTAGWLGRAAAHERLALVERLAGETAPGFSEDPGAEAAAVPLRAGGAVVCILVAERLPVDAPWEPRALLLAAMFCEMRLELEVLRRRASVAPDTTVLPDPATPASIAVLASATEPGPAAAPSIPDATGLSPLPEAAAIAGSPKVREARRFARLIATDIRLYNEEAVLAGRRQRDLSRRLADQIERGRESFQRRYPDLGADGLALLEEAYVEVLGGGDPATLAL